MENKSYDVLVVGGAVMGSSVAYHLLTLDSRLRVAVVERDPAYTRSSTALSLGGVRVQFSLKENILISLYAEDFFSRFEEEMAVGDERAAIDYRRAGYLSSSMSRKAGRREDLALQKDRRAGGM
jgi:glycine/D-amino acid oxidase-like deaminating enzyme